MEEAQYHLSNVYLFCSAVTERKLREEVPIPPSSHIYHGGVGLVVRLRVTAYSNMLVKRQCYSLSMDWKNDTFIGAFIKLLIRVLTTAMVESQTSLSKGSKNTNRLTSSFSGFCINKLTLKSIKGLLKSTSSSLAAEIVMAPMAM